MTELTRIKQYFAKIQKIETPPAERENTVNTSAAIRFIRKDLVSRRDQHKSGAIVLIKI
jgi:exosome complex protein LRP1